ncbi:LOW QUALITY PROTEIN: pseudouridine-5'-phosphatase [Engraulis encrasicolus]|uniref:LOW QUALITY PROTEIN: pseudouridine-5'-phosphatase n=1 Tax=Engraulis encrasicolus TaxID=184585 RepID=UPI002FD1B608
MQLLIEPCSHCFADTERLYTVSYQQICDRYGKEYTWEVKCAVMGKRSLDANKIIAESLELPLSPEELITESRKIQEKIFPSAALMPGAEKLVKHLHAHKVPRFGRAATSSWVPGLLAPCLDLKTSRHGDFFHLFSHVVTGDDPEVKKGKPEPDSFLVCARRFSPAPKPEQDAVNGVAAGVAARMQVVMVPDERRETALTQKATLVLRSLEDFKPELFGLPAFGS